MVEKTGATFPVGYGLKVPEDADRVGAYWEERRGIIHATNFTVGPDRKILQACFATGPIGRIAAVDALSSIRGTKKRGILTILESRSEPTAEERENRRR